MKFESVHSQHYGKTPVPRHLAIASQDLSANENDDKSDVNADGIGPLLKGGFEGNDEQEEDEKNNGGRGIIDKAANEDEDFRQVEKFCVGGCNLGRRQKKAVGFDDVQYVVNYLENYTEREGFPMPAAPRGRDNITTDVWDHKLVDDALKDKKKLEAMDSYDAEPRQLNLMIYENETIAEDGDYAKGPNAVISMIDWAIKNHGDNPASFAMHADTCPGQDNNRLLLGYFILRVMTGQQHTIEYLMQIPGHAQCNVDLGFGNIKTLYRRTECKCIDQSKAVVNKSS
ncbi:hypothetical protein DPMN_043425 [Dreissena polymorpha]|uniref:Uncharacterized protein n=1 Tax=Dreissena polymorpha TaxID=45954 RepID=A0A9D4D2P0_DREPO|nr:hypothetical protein DPMN_043425 [Dreissena polymorpha]